MGIDWQRVGVGTILPTTSPLGAPVRWGAQVLTAIPGAPAIVQTEQFIGAQASDSYPRCWGLLGTLWLPDTIWSVPPTFLASGVPDTFPVFVVLEIIMGVGQVQILHEVVLTAGNEPTFGLCNVQSAFYGGQGPYFLGSPFAAFSLDPDVPYGRPFAIIGGLIGNTIGIRARYTVGNAVLAYTSTLQIVITPFAAGDGL